MELDKKIREMNEEINKLKWYQKIPFGVWRPHFIKKKNIGFFSLSNYPFSILMSLFGICLALFFKVPWGFAFLCSAQLIEDVGFDTISYYSIKRREEKKGND